MRGGSEASNWSLADRADIVAIVFNSFCRHGIRLGHRDTQSTCILRYSAFFAWHAFAILAIPLLVALRCGLVCSTHICVTEKLCACTEHGRCELCVSGLQTFGGSSNMLGMCVWAYTVWKMSALSCGGCHSGAARVCKACGSVPTLCGSMRSKHSSACLWGHLVSRYKTVAVGFIQAIH